MTMKVASAKALPCSGLGKRVAVRPGPLSLTKVPWVAPQTS
jgi:hypothetical protein